MLKRLSSQTTSSVAMQLCVIAQSIFFEFAEYSFSKTRMSTIKAISDSVLVGRILLRRYGYVLA